MEPDARKRCFRRRVSDGKLVRVLGLMSPYSIFASILDDVRDGSLVGVLSSTLVKDLVFGVDASSTCISHHKAYPTYLAPRYYQGPSNESSRLQTITV